VPISEVTLPPKLKGSYWVESYPQIKANSAKGLATVVELPPHVLDVTPKSMQDAMRNLAKYARRQGDQWQIHYSTRDARAPERCLLVWFEAAKPSSNGSAPDKRKRP
jgi:hypothetical protein